jgi:hypothetical protein
MDNPEKLSTQGTQDEHALDTTIRKQTQITKISHEASYKQLEVKTHNRPRQKLKR